MADKVTYDSEMNQAAHRPGQEGAVNRGPQHAVPSEGDDRHHVSPPTRSAFGADSASDPAPKSAPRPAPATNTAEPSMGNKAGYDPIQSAVDKAQTG